MTGTPIIAGEREAREQFSYLRYAADGAFMRQYSAYQQRYAQDIRESDKVLLAMVGDVLAHSERRTALRVLDIGCSTGNLLRHLRRAYPELVLTGGDLAESVIAECRSNNELRGISFEVMDMLKLQPVIPHDIIIANAAMMFFTDEEFAGALASIAGALRPDGWFLAFDLFHRFEQSLSVFETTADHPQGLRIAMRPFRDVNRCFTSAGLHSARFIPFEIPIDLAEPAEASNINTYTLARQKGGRLNFRGALFLPWCHVVARRAI